MALPKCGVFTFSCPVTAVPLVLPVSVVDKDGSPFVPKILIFQGGQAILNTIRYQDALNNAWCDEMGGATPTKATGIGGGSISRFGIQIVAGVQAYHFPVIDYQSDIFFAGNMQMTATISSIYSGGFDVSIVSSTRINDFMGVALGGDDLLVDFPVDSLGAAAQLKNGTYISAIEPKGIYAPFFGWPFNTNDNNPPGYATGAGGHNCGYGWAARESSNQGVSLYRLEGQSGDDNWACTRTDRMGGDLAQANGALSTEAPVVSAWSSSGYTISGAPTGGLLGTSIVFGGTEVITKAGYFNSAGTLGVQRIDLGIYAQFLHVSTQWTPSGQNPSVTTKVSNSVGWTEGTNQVNFWCGNSDGAVAVHGARYLANTSLIRTATATGATTSFSNVAEFVHLSADGILTIDWTTVDGSIFEIVWFAIGTAVQPEFANAGKGIYKMVTDRLNDEIYLDPQTGDSALFKIPDPNVYTSLIGDE